MTDTGASLRWQAQQLEQRAIDARAVADHLDQRHAALEGRLDSVLQRHTAAVWDSRAALASRRRLQISGTGSLGRARTDIRTIIAALRSRAEVLDEDARALRRRANQLDAEAAAAEAAAAAVVATTPAREPAPAPVRYGGRVRVA